MECCCVRGNLNCPIETLPFWTVSCMVNISSPGMFFCRLYVLYYYLCVLKEKLVLYSVYLALEITKIFSSMDRYNNKSIKKKSIFGNCYIIVYFYDHYNLKIKMWFARIESVMIKSFAIYCGLNCKMWSWSLL